MNERVLLRHFQIDQTQSLRQAMQAIERNGWGVAFVMDATGLLGMVTDGDIRRALLSGAHVEDRVVHVMTSKPAVFKHSWSGQERWEYLRSTEVMRASQFDRILVPVVSNAQLVDVVEVQSGAMNSIVGAVNISSSVKHVLVIGGAGYIGSELSYDLLMKGYGVTVLDSLMYGKYPLGELLKHKRFKLVVGDTRHIEDVCEALDGVDAVVHLAELVGDPVTRMNPKLTQQVNYLATRQIAQLCKHYHIPRFIYASSCSVYGANDDFVDESSALNPVSLYAQMKWVSEQALREMSDETFAPTILRLSTVYGGSRRPRFDLMVNAMTAKAMTEGMVEVHGGSQWRPLVHVQDVVGTITKALSLPLSDVGGEVYNVGFSDENYQVGQVGEIVADAISGACVNVNASLEDVRNYKVLFEKHSSMFGDIQTHDVASGVQDLVERMASGEICDYRSPRYSNQLALRAH